METGEIIPVDQVIETFKILFDRETKNSDVELTMKEGETIGGLREQGIELMKLFHKEIRPQKIAGVEVPFSVAIPDILNGGGDLPIKLIGYFDLVERDEQGTYWTFRVGPNAVNLRKISLANTVTPTKVGVQGT